LTILPPRCLNGTEAEARDLLENLCSQAEPFFVNLGEVETFSPVTSTVYVRVQQGAVDMLRLHERLNTGPLKAEECWPYQPHLTIAKMATEQEAYRALTASRERWAHYPHERVVYISNLVFVRERDEGCWEDVAAIALNSAPVEL
jgi:2'-5' RNA ligase